jgi:hypothetical protein
METRRPARRQPLPQSEAELILSLSEEELYSRLNDLYLAGWTLQSIGNVFTPTRVRSTVRSWVLRGQETSLRVDEPLPVPKLKTLPRGYVSRRPVSPGISAEDALRLQELAPVARRYRSGMMQNTSVSLANDEMTRICLRLAAENVTVRELAAAAGVTYRAMSRRLGR